MIKGMGKELTTGLVFLGGVAVAALAADALPALAVAGALTSLCAGVYQAVSSASHSKAAKETEQYVSSRRAG
jgi:hypothetical protein